MSAEELSRPMLGKWIRLLMYRGNPHIEDIPQAGFVREWGSQVILSQTNDDLDTIPSFSTDRSFVKDWLYVQKPVERPITAIAPA